MSKTRPSGAEEWRDGAGYPVKLYVGRLIEREIADLDREHFYDHAQKGEGAHIRVHFLERADSLPPPINVEATLGREVNHTGVQGFESFIYVLEGEDWRPLPQVCTDEYDLIHNEAGWHHWGYGGHGAHDTALSILLDALRIQPELKQVVFELGLFGPILDPLKRIGQDEEWTLGLQDLVATWMARYQEREYVNFAAGISLLMRPSRHRPRGRGSG